MENNTKESSGVLLIDKPEGYTSHDVVNIVRRSYNTKRVGHTGTLDPMATGLLVVLVGRAAKAAEYIVADEKHYIAEMKLGVTSDTEDITGNLTLFDGSIPDEETVISTAETFVGDIMQIPPMYSALKVGGRKLYDIARSGITIEREARPIHISSLHCEKKSSDTYTLDVICSSGTYIRTLCADIGARLGVGAVMSGLRRLSVGGFDIFDAVLPEALKELDVSSREALLLPIEQLFLGLPRVKLPPFFERLFRSGCGVYQKKIGVSFPVGTRVAVYGAGGFFALGEAFDTDEGATIKSIKTFVLE